MNFRYVAERLPHLFNDADLEGVISRPRLPAAWPRWPRTARVRPVPPIGPDDVDAPDLACARLAKSAP